MRSLLLAATGIIAVCTSVESAAQVAPYPQSPPRTYGQPGGLQTRVTTGDIHRYEMDRLRSQADQNQSLAQSQSLQTRLTIQQLQAQRQPALIIPEPPGPMTLERARSARRAAEARGQAVARATGQIDAWLDRPPR